MVGGMGFRDLALYNDSPLSKLRGFCKTRILFSIEFLRAESSPIIQSWIPKTLDLVLMHGRAFYKERYHKKGFKVVDRE